jgi:hypothetical protein
MRRARIASTALVVMLLGCLVLASAAFGAVTRYEDNDAGIIYSAGWAPYSNARYTAGRCEYSGTAGDTATFNFTGTGIGWFSVMAPDQGLAEAWVDSEAPQTVDRYSPTYTLPLDPPKHLEVWSRQGLSNGPHTLHIRVLGQKSPAAPVGSNVWVTVDALDVTTAPPVVSTSASSTWSIAFSVLVGLALAGMLIKGRRLD